MALPARKSDQHYTYSDYKNWPEDERWELIDGVAWNMSPAPSRKHQGIFTNIFRELSTYLKDKECNIYGAPFDVRLPDGFQNEDSVDTVGRVYAGEDRVKVGIFEDLEIKMEDLLINL